MLGQRIASVSIAQTSIVFNEFSVHSKFEPFNMVLIWEMCGEVDVHRLQSQANFTSIQNLPLINYMT